MLDKLLSFLDQGLWGLSIWGQLLFLLVVTQITIATVTIFLHRHQAHRGLDLHPAVSHFFRFWLWLTTGMVTKQWVAVHRKHHARVETDADPHSPKVYGIRNVLLRGAELYRAEIDRPETLERYGHGTPDDWLERNVYTPYKFHGLALMMLIDLALFGASGLWIWAVQMLWIPFWAAGVINGAAHWWGYRNYQTSDISTNLWPLAIWIGGEELHNNHHAFSSSAKFSTKWWEFDIGWMYIRVLSALGLARVKKVAPKPKVEPAKQRIDLETVRAVIAGRLHVTSSYARKVIRPVLKEAARDLHGYGRRTIRQAKRLLARGEQAPMDEQTRAALETMLGQDSRLQTVYTFRVRLQEIWGRAAASHDTLLNALKDWCSQAEATGIKALQDFARTLRGYSLKTE